MMEITSEKITSANSELTYSGEDWVGEIPMHWEMKRLKHLFAEKKLTHDISLPCGSISFGKVVYKADEKIPESTKRSYQVLNSGEFLINPLNLNYDLISLRIGLSEIDVVVSSGYIIILPTVNLDKAFYKWLLHRFDVAFMKTLGSGVRQTISFNHIANCLLPYPPLTEQTAIASFLDKKTTLIDQAIEIKQKQIELLKERKRILIQKAVTRGLNPNVKMKDSGVEWIGEIPEHWEVKRLKYVSDIIYGISPHEKTYNDLGIGTVLINGPVEYSEEEFGYTRSLKWTTAPTKFARKGSLLFCLRGSTTGRLNICHEDVSIGRGCAALYAIEDHDYFINAMIVLKGSIIESFKGSTFPSVTSNNLNNYIIPVPPHDEQNYIASRCYEIDAKICDAVLFKVQEIEKLKEYKATLINSAVTGKIKVV